jgi:hypothetical protein
MGSLLRYSCAVSVRALLAPVLLALAWLIWGAGSAHASSEPSGPASETALNLSLSSTRSLPAVQVLPAGQVLGDSAAPAVTGVTKTVEPAVATVTKTAIPVVSTITKTATPAVATVTRTVEPVVATVTKTAAPVGSTVDRAVAAVNRAVASATQRLPLPEVKLPQLPVQDIPVGTVPKPLPEVESAVPARPAPDARQPLASRPSGAVHPSRAAAVSPTAEASSLTPASALSGTASPARAASNVAAIRNIAPPLKTFAQLRMTAAPRPLVIAVQAPQELLDEHAAAERLNIAATHGESGSSGSDSSGSHTADIAAAWNVLSPAASALADGAFVTPPSGPAVDPGSSPD